MTILFRAAKLPAIVVALCALTFLASLPASADTGSCALASAADAEITFNAQGRLTGSPPLCLFEGGKVKVKVVEDAASKEAFAVQDLERYLKVLAKLREELDQRDKPEEAKKADPWYDLKLMGLGSTDFTDVRREICRRARHLASGLTTVRATYDSQLDELKCAADASVPEPPVFVPAESSLEYGIRWSCFGREGALQSVSNTVLKEESKFFTGDALVVTDGCARIEYELRRTDPVVGRAKEWDAKKPVSLALRKAIQEGLEQLDKEPRPKDVVKKYKELAACLKIALLDPTTGKQKKDGRLALADAGQCKLPEKIDWKGAASEVAAALKTAQSIVGAVTLRSVGDGWAKRWLWLTGGVPRLDPFQFASATTLLAAQIKDDEATLADLEAEVATFDLIAANKGLAPTSLANLPAELKPFIEIRQKRDKLKQSLDQSRKKLAGLHESVESDELLYRGQLYVSQANRFYSLLPAFAVMQHHDAQNEYLVMAPRTVQEILETERLYILVENEKEDTKLKAVVTVTPITADTTGISGEIALSNPAANGDERRLEGEEIDVFAKFFDDYNRLAANLAFLDNQLEVPPLPFSPSEDRSPALITKLVPHEVPSNAPAQVKYAIQKKEGDTPEDLWKGEYRVNKLYRLRLKAGLVYSRLETSTFAIGDDKAVETRHGHGVDGIFGVQIYPFKRRDIRNPSGTDRLLPVLLIGFSMTKPQDDLYAGIGWEPWPGVTFLYGLDYGRGERLAVGSDGAKQTRNRWDHAGFYSVLIDVDFFRQLFGLKGIL